MVKVICIQDGGLVGTEISICQSHEECKKNGCKHTPNTWLGCNIKDRIV